MTDAPFSADFSRARESFVEAARNAGAHIESHGYPKPGPRGEALTNPP